MTQATRALRGYRTTQAQTASPLELVVLLYDGALRFLADAERALAARDVPARATAISKALAIVNELQNTLDLTKGGTVAEELDRLYDFVQDRLLRVTRDQDAAALADAQRVLSSLADAWRTLATTPPGATPTEATR
jgi:flagellar secretion chaperone FliS